MPVENKEIPNLAPGCKECLSHDITLGMWASQNTAETTDNLVGLWLFNFACVADCLFCYLYLKCHLEYAQNMAEIHSKIT